MIKYHVSLPPVHSPPPQYWFKFHQGSSNWNILFCNNMKKSHLWVLIESPILVYLSGYHALCLSQILLTLLCSGLKVLQNSILLNIRKKNHRGKRGETEEWEMWLFQVHNAAVRIDFILFYALRGLSWKGVHGRITKGTSVISCSIA